MAADCHLQSIRDLVAALRCPGHLEQLREALQGLGPQLRTLPQDLQRAVEVYVFKNSSQSGEPPSGLDSELLSAVDAYLDRCQQALGPQDATAQEQQQHRQQQPNRATAPRSESLEPPANEQLNLQSTPARPELELQQNAHQDELQDGLQEQQQEAAAGAPAGLQQPQLQAPFTQAVGTMYYSPVEQQQVEQSQEPNRQHPIRQPSAATPAVYQTAVWGSQHELVLQDSMPGNVQLLQPAPEGPASASGAAAADIDEQQLSREVTLPLSAGYGDVIPETDPDLQVSARDMAADASPSKLQLDPQSAVVAEAAVDQQAEAQSPPAAAVALNPADPPPAASEPALRLSRQRVQLLADKSRLVGFAGAAAQPMDIDQGKPGGIDVPCGRDHPHSESLVTDDEAVDITPAGEAALQDGEVNSLLAPNPASKQQLVHAAEATAHGQQMTSILAAQQQAVHQMVQQAIHQVVQSADAPQQQGQGSAAAGHSKSPRQPPAQQVSRAAHAIGDVDMVSAADEDDGEGQDPSVQQQRQTMTVGVGGYTKFWRQQPSAAAAAARARKAAVVDVIAAQAADRGVRTIHGLFKLYVKFMVNQGRPVHFNAARSVVNSVLVRLGGPKYGKSKKHRSQPAAQRQEVPAGAAGGVCLHSCEQQQQQQQQQQHGRRHQPVSVRADGAAAAADGFQQQVEEMQPTQQAAGQAAQAPLAEPGQPRRRWPSLQQPSSFMALARKAAGPSPCRKPPFVAAAVHFMQQQQQKQPAAGEPVIAAALQHGRVAAAAVRQQPQHTPQTAVQTAQAAADPAGDHGGSLTSDSVIVVPSSDTDSDNDADEVVILEDRAPAGQTCVPAGLPAHTTANLHRSGHVANEPAAQAQASKTLTAADVSAVLPPGAFLLPVETPHRPQQQHRHQQPAANAGGILSDSLLSTAMRRNQPAAAQQQAQELQQSAAWVLQQSIADGQHGNAAELGVAIAAAAAITQGHPIVRHAASRLRSEQQPAAAAAPASCHYRVLPPSLSSSPAVGVQARTAAAAAPHRPAGTVGAPSTVDAAAALRALMAQAAARLLAAQQTAAGRPGAQNPLAEHAAAAAAATAAAGRATGSPMIPVIIAPAPAAAAAQQAQPPAVIPLLVRLQQNPAVFSTAAAHPAPGQARGPARGQSDSAAARGVVPGKKDLPRVAPGAEQARLRDVVATVAAGGSSIVIPRIVPASFRKPNERAAKLAKAGKQQADHGRQLKRMQRQQQRQMAAQQGAVRAAAAGDVKQEACEVQVTQQQQRHQSLAPVKAQASAAHNNAAVQHQPEQQQHASLEQQQRQQRQRMTGPKEPEVNQQQPHEEQQQQHPSKRRRVEEASNTASPPDVVCQQQQQQQDNVDNSGALDALQATADAVRPENASNTSKEAAEDAAVPSKLARQAAIAVSPAGGAGMPVLGTQLPLPGLSQPLHQQDVDVLYAPASPFAVVERLSSDDPAKAVAATINGTERLEAAGGAEQQVPQQHDRQPDAEDALEAAASPAAAAAAATNQPFCNAQDAGCATDRLGDRAAAAPTHPPSAEGVVAVPLTSTQLPLPGLSQQQCLDHSAAAVEATGPAAALVAVAAADGSAVAAAGSGCNPDASGRGVLNLAVGSQLLLPFTQPIQGLEHDWDLLLSQGSQQQQQQQADEAPPQQQDQTPQEGASPNAALQAVLFSATAALEQQILQDIACQQLASTDGDAEAAEAAAVAAPAGFGSRWRVEPSAVSQQFLSTLPTDDAHVLPAWLSDPEQQQQQQQLGQHEEVQLTRKPAGPNPAANAVKARPQVLGKGELVTVADQQQHQHQQQAEAAAAAADADAGEAAVASAAAAGKMALMTATTAEQVALTPSSRQIQQELQQDHRSCNPVAAGKAAAAAAATSKDSELMPPPKERLPAAAQTGNNSNKPKQQQQHAFTQLCSGPDKQQMTSDIAVNAGRSAAAAGMSGGGSSCSLAAWAAAPPTSNPQQLQQQQLGNTAVSNGSQEGATSFPPSKPDSQQQAAAAERQQVTEQLAIGSAALASLTGNTADPSGVAAAVAGLDPQAKVQFLLQVAASMGLQLPAELLAPLLQAQQQQQQQQEDVAPSAEQVAASCALAGVSTKAADHQQQQQQQGVLAERPVGPQPGHPLSHQQQQQQQQNQQQPKSNQAGRSRDRQQQGNSIVRDTEDCKQPAADGRTQPDQLAEVQQPSSGVPDPAAAAAATQPETAPGVSDRSVAKSADAQQAQQQQQQQRKKRKAAIAAVVADIMLALETSDDSSVSLSLDRQPSAAIVSPSAAALEGTAVTDSNTRRLQQQVQWRRATAGSSKVVSFLSVGPATAGKSRTAAAVPGKKGPVVGKQQQQQQDQRMDTIPEEGEQPQASTSSFSFGRPTQLQAAAAAPRLQQRPRSVSPTGSMQQVAAKATAAVAQTGDTKRQQHLPFVGSSQKAAAPALGPRGTVATGPAAAAATRSAAGSTAASRPKQQQQQRTTASTDHTKDNPVIVQSRRSATRAAQKPAHPHHQQQHPPGLKRSRQHLDATAAAATAGSKMQGVAFQPMKLARRSITPTPPAAAAAAAAARLARTVHGGQPAQSTQPPAEGAASAADLVPKHQQLVKHQQQRKTPQQPAAAAAAGQQPAGPAARSVRFAAGADSREQTPQQHNRAPFAPADPTKPRPAAAAAIPSRSRSPSPPMPVDPVDMIDAMVTARASSPQPLLQQQQQCASQHSRKAVQHAAAAELAGEPVTQQQQQQQKRRRAAGQVRQGLAQGRQKPQQQQQQRRAVTPPAVSAAAGLANPWSEERRPAKHLDKGGSVMQMLFGDLPSSALPAVSHSAAPGRTTMAGSQATAPAASTTAQGSEHEHTRARDAA